MLDDDATAPVRDHRHVALPGTFGLWVGGDHVGPRRDRLQNDALLGGLFAMYAGNDPSSAKAIVAGVRPAMLGGAIAEGLGAILAFLAIPTAALASRGDVRLISASSE